jgi:GTP cyclohydrolase I
MPVDRERVRRAVAEIIEAIGEDSSRPGLANTPGLVAEAYAEMFAGLDIDPRAHLAQSIPFEGNAETVIVSNIHLRSVCEHHLLPFTGRAHVAYIPGDRIVGLGKIPRVVHALAARPQIQERLTDDIATVFDQELSALGVLVVLESSHQCLSARGANENEATTITIASRGTLSDPAARAETMAMFRVEP